MFQRSRLTDNSRQKGFPEGFISAITNSYTDFNDLGWGGALAQLQIHATDLIQLIQLIKA